MHILFGWGEDPSVDDMPYRVLSYNFDVVSESGDTMISNCQPTHIALTVEVPPDGDAGREFFNFASEQHDTAAENGKGKIAVFRGRAVGESIQEVTFNNGWIDSLSISASQGDDKFIITAMIAAAEITVSGVEFTHHTRAEHFAS
jgi:hypothetical protein